MWRQGDGLYKGVLQFSGEGRDKGEGRAPSREKKELPDQRTKARDGLKDVLAVYMLLLRHPDT